MFLSGTKEIIFLNTLQVPQRWHGATECIKMQTKLNNYKMHYQLITEVIFKDGTSNITDFISVLNQTLSVTHTNHFCINVPHNLFMPVIVMESKQAYKSHKIEQLINSSISLKCSWHHCFLTIMSLC